MGSVPFPSPSYIYPFVEASLVREINMVKGEEDQTQHGSIFIMP